jgi:hydroxyacylglutathione hydrolase
MSCVGSSSHLRFGKQHKRATERLASYWSKPSVPVGLLLLPLCLLLIAERAPAQVEPGSLDVHWNEGAANCAKNTQPPLQVHRYNANTFILRENLCATVESPFMYLLTGSARALLIDTGDVSDPKQMPLAKTVLDLLPAGGSAQLPLLVVHTHRHQDHRAGDGQFAQFPNTQVVGFDLDSVKRFYGFSDWPNGMAQIALGNRTIEVIPTPGHNETEVSFYDGNTGLVFTGDFLMPARVLIEDIRQDQASTQRLIDFVKNRPVIYLLGGHIEMNAQGKFFPRQSHYHPNEHVLQMKEEDLVALPAALSRFNGFYKESGEFVMMNQIRILAAEGLVAGLVLVGLIWIGVRYFRGRRLVGTR